MAKKPKLNFAGLTQEQTKMASILHSVMGEKSAQGFIDRFRCPYRGVPNRYCMFFDDPHRICDETAPAWCPISDNHRIHVDRANCPATDDGETAPGQ